MPAASQFSERGSGQSRISRPGRWTFSRHTAPNKLRFHASIKLLSAPSPAVLTGTALATDIQSAWEKASALLPCASPNPQVVVDLVAALRDCAERARAIGFLGGERELVRMAGYLEGRISQSVYSRYGADGLIQA